VNICTFSVLNPLCQFGIMFGLVTGLVIYGLIFDQLFWLLVIRATVTDGSDYNSLHLI